MADLAPPTVRPARGSDAEALAALLHAHAHEVGRADPRLAPSEGAHARMLQAAHLWGGQDERAAFVAVGADDRPIGCAIGLVEVWPPVWRAQRIGTVTDLYVVPDRRATGVEAALLHALGTALARRGADHLRAFVPVRDAAARASFEAEGYAPLLRVFERAASEA